MKRLFLALALCASCLAASACTPPRSAGDVIAATDTRLTSIESTYAEAKVFADVLLPLLPPKIADRVRVAEAGVEAALSIARDAATAAARVKALSDAQSSLDTLNAVTSAPPQPG